MPCANFSKKARKGLSFNGATKKEVAEKLVRLPALPHFRQLILLLEIFQTLATSEEALLLGSRPVSVKYAGKEQERMNAICRYIEENYQQPIDVNEVASHNHLTTAAFCRYFKKTTHLTFTDFVNQYRINQAKKMLLHNRNVTEACYESGFGNLAYFTRTFKKLAGENPSHFRKRHSLR